MTSLCVFHFSFTGVINLKSLISVSVCVSMMKRVEIDTRAPFRSVKEALTLFGDKVLAGELYATKLRQMQGGGSENGYHGLSRHENFTAELEETKQSLQKAKEESIVMATCLSSIKTELERTKLELQQLKLEHHESDKQPMETEIVDVKFVEDSTKFEVKIPASDHDEEAEEKMEFQKKRYETNFENPPSFEQVSNPREVVEKLERHPPPSPKKKMKKKKKKKKNMLFPVIGRIFSKKKGSPEVVALPRDP